MHLYRKYKNRIQLPKMFIGECSREIVRIFICFFINVVISLKRNLTFALINFLHSQ